LLRLAVASSALPALVALQGSSAAAQLVQPRVQRVRLDSRNLIRTASGHPAGPGRPAPQMYRMDRLATGPFRLAGFTWADGPSEAAIQIRTRTMATGTWSSWATLHDDGHGPDPGTAAAGEARRGTAPLIVAESDAVEIRIESPDGTIPEGLQASLIEPGSSDADLDAGTASSTAAGSGLPQPTIRTRADWGADESIMTWDPEYGEVRGMFVHHTAGGNSYTEAEVPGIIRGIYLFHAIERGWGDIGYNFVIDKFGRIWEGRYGGIAKALIGGHTLGYNAYSFGAAVLGNYVAKQPEPMVLQAFEELVAWKFLLHGVYPDTTFAYPGKKTLPTISGHRERYATKCPGDLLYAKLETIRVQRS
jgi:hypothetical protein